jgi:hypothetical protein
MRENSSSSAKSWRETLRVPEIEAPSPDVSGYSGAKGKLVAKRERECKRKLLKRRMVMAGLHVREALGFWGFVEVLRRMFGGQV